MDRDIKIFNRPVMEKMQKKSHDLHLQRLKDIKIGACNRTSLSKSGQRHLNNKKPVLMEEEKRTEIEKQNLILFNKMNRIMQRADQSQNPFSNYTLHNSKIENNNQRIRSENKNMLQRLETQKSTISNKKLIEQRNKNLTLLRFLGKYPNKSAHKMRIQTQGNYSQNYRYSDMKRKSLSTQNRIPVIEDFEVKYQEDIREEQDLKKKQQVKYDTEPINYKNTQSLFVNDVLLAGLSKLEGIDVGSISRAPSLNRVYGNIVLFQARGFIDKKYASIYFERCYNTYVIKVVFDTPVFGQICHFIQFTEEDGNNFFSEWNYEYPRIMKLLKFEKNQLCVGNPEESSSKNNTRYFASTKTKKKQWVEKPGYSGF